MTAFYVRYIENGRECWDVVETVRGMADALRILNEAWPIPPEPLQIVSCREFPSATHALRYHDETHA